MRKRRTPPDRERFSSLEGLVRVYRLRKSISSDWGPNTETHASEFSIITEVDALDGAIGPIGGGGASRH